MIRVLLLLPQAALLALIGYNTITALWGWRDRRPAPAAPPLRLRVVVPAHDEERVIGGLLSDLAGQDHPAEMRSVFVVADRCQDRTRSEERRVGKECRSRWSPYR